jgi:4-amino-4-deoxy-L-arabinose transferase-like glycosyltransferase
MTFGGEPEAAFTRTARAEARRADTMVGRVFDRVRRRPLRYGLVCVLLVACGSVLISAQGWKSRMLVFDLLTYYYASQEFLDSGALPRHGDTGSYGSYKPPGTAWLMMPGTALLGDPRAAAYIGTGLLHLATLTGIFLLAWRTFGTWPALISVLLYGFSAHGLFMAGSLWPNGRPDFYVWIVLFTCLWAMRRNARWLAAALMVWGIGMYVDMGIAPALLILPVVWWLYRPPLRLLPLAVAGLVALTVWTPYLRLEATRGFADVKSQLFLRHIRPPDYRRSWCDSSLTLVTRSRPEAVSADAGRSTGSPGAQARIGMLKDKVLSNFTHAVAVPGAALPLMALVLSAMLLCTASTGAGPGLNHDQRGAATERRRVTVATLLMTGGIVLFALTSGVLPGVALLPDSGVARKLPQILFLVGFVLWATPALLAIRRRFLRWCRADFEPTQQMTLLVVSLAVPWAILVVVAEPGKPERFWWVWPTQVIFLAASVAYFLPKFGVPRALRVFAQLVVALLLLRNWFVLARVDSWRKDGWDGTDPEEVRVIDYVAKHIRHDGKTSAAVGYQLFIYPFMAEYHVTNTVYRAGGELELQLRYRHGITNTNQCAEGISPADDYRIVQQRPKDGPEEPQHYFAVPLGKDYRLMQRFDFYEVYKRVN